MLGTGKGEIERENIPSTAIVTPAIPPGDNLGLEVVELPLALPAAVEFGPGELVDVGEFRLVCVELERLVEKTGIDVSLVVRSVENI